MILIRSMRQQIFKYISVLTIIFALFSAVIVVSAQTIDPDTDHPSITLESESAFNGTFKYGEWLPIWVEVENDGQNLDGLIRIAVTSSSGRTFYAVPIDLPVGSRKRVPVYVLPNNFSHELEVELVSGDQVVASQVVEINPQPTINYLAGLVAPERGALALINGVELPGRDRPIVLVDLALDELPSRYVGLRSLDLIVMNDIDTSQLSPEQLRSLETWVRRGGRLVIGTGSGVMQTAEGLSPTLLPVSILGIEEIQKLPDLENFVEPNEIIRVPGPFTAAAAELDGGRTLVSEGDLKLVHEWSLGNGFIDFVALNLSYSPFDAWSGTTDFWQKLISPKAEYPDYLAPDVSTRQQAASQMPNMLSNLPILDLPSIQSLAFILGFYILVVGPINYLVLRRKNILHYAWITIPSITIIFSVVAFGLGFALHGSDIFINQISLVHLEPDGNAYIDSYLGLFSPDRGIYEVEVRDGGLLSPLYPYTDPWNSVPDPGFGNREITLVQGNPGFVNGLSVEQWSMQSFMAEGIIMDFGRMDNDLVLEGNTLNGTLVNNSPYMIEDAFIIVGKKFLSLGDLPSDKPIHVEMDLSDISSPDLTPSIGYMLFENRYQNGNSQADTRQIDIKRMLVESVFDNSYSPISSSLPPPPSGGTFVSSRKPVFLGWLHESPPQIYINGDKPSQQTTAMVYYPLNFDLPEHGAVSIPVGLVPGELVQSPVEGGQCGPAGETAVYIARGEAIFDFQVSQEMIDLEVDNIKLAVWSDSGGFDPPDITIYNWVTESWVNLSGINPGINLIPTAAWAFGQDGLIKIRLSAESERMGCYYFGLGIEGWR